MSNNPPDFIFAQNLFKGNSQVTIEQNGTTIGLPVNILNFTGSTGMTYDGITKIISIPIGANGIWDGYHPSDIHAGLGVNFICAGDGQTLTINSSGSISTGLVNSVYSSNGNTNAWRKDPVVYSLTSAGLTVAANDGYYVTSSDTVTIGFPSVGTDVSYTVYPLSNAYIIGQPVLVTSSTYQFFGTVANIGAQLTIHISTVIHAGTSSFAIFSILDNGLFDSQNTPSTLTNNALSLLSSSAYAQINHGTYRGNSITLADGTTDPPTIIDLNSISFNGNHDSLIQFNTSGGPPTTGNTLSIIGESGTATGGNILIQSGDAPTKGVIELCTGATVIETISSTGASLNGHQTFQIQGSPGTSAAGPSVTAVADRLVNASRSGMMSETIGAYPYNQGDGYVAHSDRQMGTFILVGTAMTKTLTFSTAIHGNPIHGTSVLVGKLQFGWIGNGSVSTGGAVELMFVVTTDSSGNVFEMQTSASNNVAASGGTSTILSGTAPTSDYGVSMYTVESATTPLLVIGLPTTNTFTFEFTAINNDSPSAVAKYFWTIEYGFGATA